MPVYRVTIDGSSRPFTPTGRGLIDFTPRPKYCDRSISARVTIVVEGYSPADAVRTVGARGVNYHPDTEAVSLSGGLGIDSVTLGEWSLVNVRLSRATRPTLTRR